MSQESKATLFPGIIPVSLNRILRMNPFDRARYWKLWRHHLLGGLGKCHPRATERRYVRVVVWRKRALDHDNLVGSAKPILDALVRLGWLKDDSPKWVKSEVQAGEASRLFQEGTGVLVRPLREGEV